MILKRIVNAWFCSLQFRCLPAGRLRTPDCVARGPNEGPTRRSPGPQRLRSFPLGSTNTVGETAAAGRRQLLQLAAEAEAGFGTVHEALNIGAVLNQNKDGNKDGADCYLGWWRMAGRVEEVDEER